MQQPNAVVWVRVMTEATVIFPNGERQKFTWPEGKHGSVPVCNGGALSIETWETSSQQFLESELFAPGEWKRF